MRKRRITKKIRKHHQHFDTNLKLQGQYSTVVFDIDDVDYVATKEIEVHNQKLYAAKNFVSKLKHILNVTHPNLIENFGV